MSWGLVSYFFAGGGGGVCTLMDGLVFGAAGVLVFFEIVLPDGVLFGML